jgi:predicted metal-dependent peptidase
MNQQLTPEEIVEKAMGRVCLESGLLSHLLYKYERVENTEIPKFRCNETELHYNPKYLLDNQRDLNQLRIDMLYAAMAAVLQHSLRAKQIPNLQPHIFNEAAGIASTNSLKEYGFKLPAEYNVDVCWDGKSAEEIYKQMRDEQDGDDDDGDDDEQDKNGGAGAGVNTAEDIESDDSKDGDDSDGDGDGDTDGDDGDDEQDGDGDGDSQEDQNAQDSDSKFPVHVSPAKASTPEEQKQAERDAELAMIGGINADKTFGHMSAGVERLLKSITDAHIPPYEIMSRFIIDKCKIGNDWSRQSRRHIHTSTYMPRHRSTGILNDLILGLDTSISVTDEMNIEHIRMTFDICASVDQSGVTPRLTAIYCDSAVCGVEELEAGQQPTPYGGGGTRFAPVFTYIVENDMRPKGVIYFTDGELYNESYIIGKHGRDVQAECDILWVLTKENESFVNLIRKLDFGECVTIQR